MEPSIHIKPDKVWEFFCWNREKLKVSEAIIAENKGTDYMICLTNDGDFPMFIVYRNGVETGVRQKVVSAQNCAYITEYLFERFLYPYDVTESIPETPAKPEPAKEPTASEDEDDLPPADSPADPTDDEEWEQLVDECHEPILIPSRILDPQDPYYEVMYVRQDEVDLAAKDFLRVLLERVAVTNAMADDFVQHTMQWLAEEYDVSVWYPGEFTDPDTGEDYFETYPYESLCGTPVTEVEK